MVKKILAISGSTRTNSTNETILKWIASTYQDQLDVQVYSGIAALPYFNPDIADDYVSSEVRALRQLIQQADGVIICTPEYVFSLPGAIKNAIEWTVSTTVFSDKPAGLIVASGVGEKAYESLILIMKTVGAKFDEDATLLIKGARSKFDAQGDFKDPSTKADLEKLMKSFIGSLSSSPPGVTATIQ